MNWKTYTYTVYGGRVYPGFRRQGAGWTRNLHAVGERGQLKLDVSEFEANKGARL